MSLSRYQQHLSAIKNEYPPQFWMLLIGTFIDRLGSFILFPFFTLYVTRKFGLGMTSVGLIFGVFSLSSFAGSMFGGALSDRFGRKGMVIFGLTASALSSLMMGLVNSLGLFFVVAMITGLLADAGGPAQQAMVADLLPEEKRAQGYGLVRVVANLSAAIGPAIGGLLATHSYMYLFVGDAISSIVTAFLVYLLLPETKPAHHSTDVAPTILQTFRGYGKVLRDSAFMAFMLASGLMVIVYIQMNSTLAVFLRDVQGVSEQGFGYILSLNAAMVVLFQFAITRRLTPYRPLILMAIGSFL